jgi:hypothetical protein
VAYSLLASDGTDPVSGGYLPADATEGSVSGLTNGRTYTFAVVAYLASGSPARTATRRARPRSPLTHHDAVVMQQGRMRSWNVPRPEGRDSYVDLGTEGTARVYVFALTATGSIPCSTRWWLREQIRRWGANDRGAESV